MGAHPHTAYRRQPEKRIQADIRRALAALGFVVHDMSQPRRSMMPEGLPDLYAVHERWRLRGWIEVKTPTGRVRPTQVEWQRLERASGGNSDIARSVEDALRIVQDWGAPITVHDNGNVEVHRLPLNNPPPSDG